MKRLTTIILIGLCALKLFGCGGGGSSPAPTALQPPAPLPRQVFLLMGQSNMSGRGDIPAEQATSPLIFNFANSDTWQTAIEPVDSATDQVDFVSRDAGAGYSPATSFARELLPSLPAGTEIGLVP